MSRYVKSREQMARYNETQKIKYAIDSSYRERMKNWHKQKSGTYKSWKNMRGRVLCSSATGHKWYKTCPIDPRWNKFQTFHEDMGDRPEGLTLDRIDNSKGYYKDNCRWVSQTIQSQNTRLVKLSIEKARNIRSSSLPNYILAKEYGVDPSIISTVRHNKAWVEVANV